LYTAAVFKWPRTGHFSQHFSLLYVLKITKVNFVKFSGGITSSINIHAAGYIASFQAMQYARQHHFEATKHLV
jgi:hypothetical protein